MNGPDAIAGSILNFVATIGTNAPITEDTLNVRTIESPITNAKTRF